MIIDLCIEAGIVPPLLRHLDTDDGLRPRALAVSVMFPNVWMTNSAGVRVFILIGIG